MELTTTPVAAAVHSSIAASDDLGDTVTYAFTIMPDHFHWLFLLGDRLSLGRVIARLKAQTHESMKATGLAWQTYFFEHRLRIEESIEPYGLYVFRNPYRAGLVPAQESWPHWWSPQSDGFRFTRQLNPDGTPPPAWLSETIPQGLATGE